MRWLVLVLLAPSAQADILVAERTIRPKEIIAAGDVGLRAGEAAGTLDHPDLAIGQEARAVLYAGRPIAFGDVGPPARVERNAIVPLIYDRGGIRILTEGRAMERGGTGDIVRVMNLASRSIVTGRVHADGTVTVGGPVQR